MLKDESYIIESILLYHKIFVIIQPVVSSLLVISWLSGPIEWPRINAAIYAM